MTLFVHASGRSGSTYIFSAFRRKQELMCFNEAIIDGKRDYRSLPSSSGWDVNHHFLQEVDHYEFLVAWDKCMHLCPAYPTFDGYLALGLRWDLQRFLYALTQFARSRQKRPAFFEINSRGRAAALRKEFGGLHITQYRDPISQFGSYLRPLMEAKLWGFLAHPVTELGINNLHPLCQVIPHHWRVPQFNWDISTRARRWESDARYIAFTAKATTAQLFRWHLFAWFLFNLAALCFSDRELDIDLAFSDLSYRQDLEKQFGLDLSNIKNYTRYYRFLDHNTLTVCCEVEQAINAALDSGELSAAIWTLGEPVTPVGKAASLLLAKLRQSMDSFKASNTSNRMIGSGEWTVIRREAHRIWFDPTIRKVATKVYPLAVHAVHAARRTGLYQ